NTLQEQWSQGSGAYDYAELRMSGTVPVGASGCGYNLAFFSTEYPGYYQTGYNDMYVAWLQSEVWTGNISFDEMGNPISLNAGFLDYKDAPNPYDCPAPCTAPELQGTVMQTHAGTKWLTTTAGVSPGEDITIIWAIWDLSDEVLDSVVILDDFRWNFEGGPPVTIPCLYTRGDATRQTDPLRAAVARRVYGPRRARQPRLQPEARRSDRRVRIRRPDLAGLALLPGYRPGVLG